jgi:hypothetical protein
MQRSKRPSAGGSDSTMSISVNKCGGRTRAKVEFHWAGRCLTGTGVAFRHPADCLTDEDGQNVATARALVDLADRLHAGTRVTTAIALPDR